MHMKETWQERFDDEFCIVAGEGEARREFGFDESTTPSAVKAFILKELTLAKEEERKEIMKDIRNILDEEGVADGWKVAEFEALVSLIRNKE